MEMVCPICNGLSSYVVKCSFCGSTMEAQAAIQDYYDDYSPYLDKEITEKLDGVSKVQCLHIFYCPQCHRDKRIPIDKMLM
ncbi:hypothetical protein [Clostridium formicaceticum]|uniref:Uncharacterized protein n=1 Tax=Clostridium formicaceticum TaxID=1497 RepID=A0AAC9WFU5_9CLOT|nr:hypothetical protein [Clostridium formicaceticum]AOY76636.1 hypothetical protein BJL90_12640 [Clostridium formicaceticum]ARE87059.1 hypothetical protein CLFO_14450 [Clostridium formicaceticum]